MRGGIDIIAPCVGPCEGSGGGWVAGWFLFGAKLEMPVRIPEALDSGVRDGPLATGARERTAGICRLAEAEVPCMYFGEGVSLWSGVVFERSYKYGQQGQKDSSTTYICATQSTVEAQIVPVSS
jgi:hypothetical protein